MPARRPEHMRHIELPMAAARPDPTQEQIEQRKERRRNAILTGGPMEMVLQAIIESGDSLEIDAGTHIVSILVTPK